MDRLEELKLFIGETFNKAEDIFGQAENIKSNLEKSVCNDLRGYGNQVLKDLVKDGSSLIIGASDETIEDTKTFVTDYDNNREEKVKEILDHKILWIHKAANGLKLQYGKEYELFNFDKALKNYASDFQSFLRKKNLLSSEMAYDSDFGQVYSKGQTPNTKHVHNKITITYIRLSNASSEMLQQYHNFYHDQIRPLMADVDKYRKEILKIETANRWGL